MISKRVRAEHEQAEQLDQACRPQPELPPLVHDGPRRTSAAARSVTNLTAPAASPVAVSESNANANPEALSHRVRARRGL